MTWPTPDSIAVYIHWPFCAKKCPYCDFAVTVRREIDEAAVLNALITELHANASLYDTIPPAHSIFFGGGTPSLMSSASVECLIEAVQRAFGTTPDCEISLEANPTDAEAEKFARFRAAGVNRLSLGVQSLDDTELTLLGRNHDAEQARRALDTTAKHFDNFSIDLIYALPGQRVVNWPKRIETMLNAQPTHVSLYQLTIEPNTVFQRAVQRRILTPFDDDAAADLYLETSDLLQSHGYHGYEVSNHARPGYECRHNQSYWRYQDYVGVGPGAHGRLTLAGQKQATRNLRAFQAWIDQVTRRKHGRKALEPLSALDADEEAFLMSMRTGEGAIIGDALSLNQSNLDLLMRQAMIEPLGNGFRPTRQGWLRLDWITGMLLT